MTATVAVLALIAAADPSIIVAVIALIGVVTTGLFQRLEKRQTDARANIIELRSVSQREMETALLNQRERLDDIHGEYRTEIDSILAGHARQIAGMHVQYEGEIGELHRQIEGLRAVAATADERADKAESHAHRCEAALAGLQAAHDELRTELERMKR